MNDDVLEYLRTLVYQNVRTSRFGKSMKIHPKPVEGLVSTTVA
jgi:hypothetical protein